ncbi:hypothetical protein MKEN_00975000 [Mycena kentingensis (nom. inval.)]|nr:hypothetical protein MKEN_00975000 [Mycena kentingensis (nom. inval.)]
MPPSLFSDGPPAAQRGSLPHHRASIHPYAFVPSYPAEPQWKAASPAPLSLPPAPPAPAAPFTDYPSSKRRQPVRAAPYSRNPHAAREEKPEYPTYSVLLEKYLERKERSRVQMARKRAADQHLPQEARDELANRDRHYRAKYRARNRDVLAAGEATRREAQHRERYGSPLCEEYRDRRLSRFAASTACAQAGTFSSDEEASR